MKLSSALPILKHGGPPLTIPHMETTYFKKGLPLPAKDKEGGAGKKKSASPFASTLVGKSPADSKIS